MTCEVLCLDVTRCRQNGIRAIFGQYTRAEKAGTQEEEMSSQTCVGLINAESFDQARSSGAELLTIGLQSQPGTPVYEAIRVPGTSPPEYRIIGDWVPLRDDLRVTE